MYGEIPKNNFAALRENLDLSQQKLADKIGCSKLLILKTEQGTYPEVPPVIMDWWVNQNGMSELILRDTYEEFQQKVRYHYLYFFGDLLPVDINKPIHPLVQLIHSSGYDLSINDISKRTCTAQNTLQYWIKKWRTQQTVPKSFAIALLGMGYSVVQVDYFCEQYKAWRANNK